MRRVIPAALRRESPRRWPWHSGPVATFDAGVDEAPDVTVVTPSMNQGEFVEETIRSVLLQEGVALEYIVRDGGSSDGTMEVLGHYSPVLSALGVGPDGGQASALALAFSKARGEVLGFVNSDDTLLPGALAHVVEMFRRMPEAMVVMGRTVVIDANGSEMTRAVGLPPTYRSLLEWGTGGFCQPSVFVRRRAYSSAGGIDSTLRFAFDLDLFVRLAKSHRFYRTPQFLSAFRHHSTSKTFTIPEVRENENAIVRDRHHDACQSGSGHLLLRGWFQLRFLGYTAFVRCGDAMGKVREKL